MEATHPNLTQCCMCGDIGFPDKLFQCVRCICRFQHSYCGNYYDGTSTEADKVCDWCRGEERSGGRHKKAVEKVGTTSTAVANRSEYLAGERIKQGDNGNADDDCGAGGRGSGGKVKPGSGSSSGKSTGRRYKLLKDVMC